MWTTIDLSDRTYERLRQTAAERGVRDFSVIVEEALENFFEAGAKARLVPEMAEAEGSWSASDRDEWERARRNVWNTWPAQSRDPE